MAPPIAESKIALSYPLYACDFDPQDTTRLLCGGGGGAGRSGVGNKITVLDTSHDPIQVSAEAELSRDEDNVTTLAVGPRRNGTTTLVYAGINSGAEHVKKGSNEHFRVFGLDPPSRAAAKATPGPHITELSRSQLFSAAEADTYQRLLRVAPPGPGGAQVGAVATGLAREPQIVLFDVPAAGAAPGLRGRVEIRREAVDLDIVPTGGDTYRLAYCDAHELYVVDVAKGGVSDPEVAYTIEPDTVRPAFRSIRHLAPGFLVAATNLPKRAGVVLQVLRLPPGPQARARIATNARLPRSVGQATGLAVANLSPAAPPSARQGDTQFVVAVAGHDLSISLYTLEHQTAGDVDLLARLYPLRTLRAAHHGYITALAFAPFTPPRTSTARVQQLRLASVSVGNTVAVHSIPLRKVLERAPARRGPPRPPRYVVALQSRAPGPASLLLLAAVVVLLLGVLAQGVAEVKGLARPVMGARRVVPASWRAPVPARWEAGAATPQHHRRRGGPLAELLAEKRLAEGGAAAVLVARDAAEAEDGAGGGGGVAVEAHDEEAHGPARTWEELPPEQQSRWRARLKAGGHWAEDTGETLFKGILFSELGGAVGAAVRG